MIEANYGARCIVLTPFELPYVALLRAARRTAALSVRNLGVCPRAAAEALAAIPKDRGPQIRAQLFEQTAELELPACVTHVVLDRPSSLERHKAAG